MNIKNAMDAKVTHTFTVGSSAFFFNMSDFKSKDIDKVCFLDLPVFGNKIMNIRKDGDDVFFLHDSGKDNLLEQCLREDNPMGAGKFLVPKFAEHIGLTIEDLKRLKPLINKLDENHYYEKIIYDSYIENNGFYLTDEQLNLAYKEYKKVR